MSSASKVEATLASVVAELPGGGEARPGQRQMATAPNENPPPNEAEVFRRAAPVLAELARKYPPRAQRRFESRMMPELVTYSVTEAGAMLRNSEMTVYRMSQRGAIPRATSGVGPNTLGAPSSMACGSGAGHR